jgi:hypothetical protein
MERILTINHLEDSQVTLVLNHLKEGKEINPMEALSKYGCYRLGAVIFLLRGEGYKIDTRIEKYKKANGKKGHYAVYKLSENQEEILSV